MPYLRLPKDGNPAEATIQTDPFPFFAFRHLQSLTPEILGRNIFLQFTQTLYPDFNAQDLHLPRVPTKRGRTLQTLQFDFDPLFGDLRVPFFFLDLVELSLEGFLWQ